MDFSVKGAEIILKFVILYFRAFVNEALGFKGFITCFLITRMLVSNIS